MILICACHMYLLNDNLRVYYMDEIGSPPDRAKKSNCSFTWFGKMLSSSTNIALNYMVPDRIAYNPGQDIWNRVEKSGKPGQEKKSLSILDITFRFTCG